MKRSFFDTGFAVHAGIAQQLSRLVRFMIDNRNSIFPEEELSRLAMPIATILKTPMAECFDRIIPSGTLGNFCSFYISDKSSGIPELLSTSSITIDAAQAPEAGWTLPELKRKVLVNLTSVLKADRVRGGYMVSAVDTFQSLFVRGQMVIGYNDLTEWLSPYLAEYTVKTYSMILSGLISRYYSLSLPETMRVAGIFALHFCQLLSPEGADLECPPLFMHCTFLGNRAELMAMAKAYSYKSATGLDLVSCCELVAEMGVEKLSHFNSQSMLAMAGTLGPDLITSQIALEYPPYWVWMLVLSLSGAKVPLIYQLNQHKLNNEGKSRWISKLLGSREIFEYRRF